MATTSPLGTTASTLDDVAKSVMALGGNLNIASVYAKKLQDDFKRYSEAKAILESIEKRSGKLSASYQVQANKVNIASQAVLKSAKVSAQAEAAQKALTASVKKSETQYDRFAKHVATAQNTMRKWVPVLGGTTITINKAKDALLQYNQGLFTLSRTYKVTGSGMQNFEGTLKDIGKTTTMSKNQFLEFSQAAINGWKGVRPGIAVVGKLAEVMQKQFGYGTKQATEGLNALLEVMKKFPAVGQLLSKTLVDMNEEIKNSGKLSKNTENRMKSMKGTLSMMALSGQLSEEAFTKNMQALRGVTKEEEALIKTNQKLADNAKKFEDTMLELGKQVEPILRVFAAGLGKVMDYLQDMPGQIIAVAGAFKILSAQAKNNQLQQLISGVTGTAGPTTASKAPLLSKLFGGGGAAGGASKFGGGGTAGIFAGAMTAYGEFTQRRREGEGYGTAGGSAAIKGGGALAGAIGGAALGTAVAGPAGTIVGGALGGLGGAYIGEVITDKLFPEMKKVDDESKKVEASNAKVKSEIERITLELMKSKQQYELIVGLAKESAGYTQKQIDALSGIGLINTGNVGNLFGQMIADLETVNKESKKWFTDLMGNEGLGTILGNEYGIEFSAGVKNALAKASQGGDIKEFLGGDQFRNMMKQLEAEAQNTGKDYTKKKTEFNTETNVDKKAALGNELNEIEAKRFTISTAITEAIKARTNIQESEIKTSKAIIQATREISDNAHRLNSVYEERLSLERDVMEAAQFGMGASLDMMQRQIDMGHELIAVEKQRGEALDQSTGAMLKQNGYSKDAADSIKAQLKGAKSHMQAQQIILKLGLDEGALKSNLIQYAQQQQDISKKELQQQKKIYEITKEVREGYLDAITEAAIGFGEFEKIIGTQNMGTTQLMDAVNSYTTTGDKNVLNTMALGGYQNKGSEVGRDITGQFSAQPNMATLRFIEGEEQDKRNARLYGYQDSVNAYKETQNGTGMRKGVGSANALTPEYEGAVMDPAAMEKANYDGTYKGFIDAAKILKSGQGGVGYTGGNMDIMSPINRGRYAEQGVGMGRRRNPNMGADFGAGITNGVRSSSPATNVRQGSDGVRGRHPSRGNAEVIGGYEVPSTVGGRNAGAQHGGNEKINAIYKKRMEEERLKLSGGNSGSGGNVNRNQMISELDRLGMAAENPEIMKRKMEVQDVIAKIKKSNEPQAKALTTKESESQSYALSGAALGVGGMAAGRAGRSLTGMSNAVELGEAAKKSRYRDAAGKFTKGTAKEQLARKSAIARGSRYSKLSAKSLGRIGSVGKFAKGAGRVAGVAGAAAYLGEQAYTGYKMVTSEEERDKAVKESQAGAHKVNESKGLWGRTKAVAKQAGYGLMHPMESVAGLGSALGEWSGDKKYGVAEGEQEAQRVEGNAGALRTAKRKESNAIHKAEQDVANAKIEKEKEEAKKASFIAAAKEADKNSFLTSYSSNVASIPENQSAAQKELGALGDAGMNPQQRKRAAFEKAASEANITKEEAMGYYKGEKQSGEWRKGRAQKYIQSTRKNFTEMAEEGGGFENLTPEQKEDYVKRSKEKARSSIDGMSKQEAEAAGNAEKIRMAQQRAAPKPKTLNEEESIQMAQNWRQTMGAMEGKTSEEIAAKMTGEMVSGGAKPWETMTPEKQAEIRAKISQASKMKYKSGVNIPSALKGQIASQVSGVSSKEQTHGAVSPEMQAAIRSDSVQQQMQETFATGGGGPIQSGDGSGGGGSVKVTVYLGADLRGQIDSQGSVISELVSASSKG